VGSIVSNSVNASKKTLLAAVIVAAGYGTASLCGHPMATLLPTHESAADSPGLTRQSTGAPPLATSVSPPPTSFNTARLVPDNANHSASQVAARVSPDLLSVTEPETTGPALPAMASPLAESPALFQALSPGEPDGAEPRAKLRDEAPRPVGYSARPDAEMSRAAPVAATSTVVDAPRTNVGGAPQPSPGSSWVAEHANTPPPERTAAWHVPFNSDNLTPIPIRTLAEDDEPRTHIVVDGDSLAKLAGRYLDDPHRADEIYQLNRDLLSDPELLPIGVELTIPARASHALDHRLSPQSNLPRAVAIHSSHGNGLVPVRPVPATSTLAPRARLVSPRHAE
jgi:nucleoid-associated protein YgaU